jgi:hypothetical protein
MLRQVALLAVLGALLSTVLITLPAPVFAQEDDTTRARTEFQHGVELFQNSDYQRALDAFQEAYRLAPHASVRLNIANCYEQLGRPVEALFHFEHYLAEADHPAAAQRREIEASIRRLRGQIGTITFQITPDGATVTIDATDQRRSPVTEPVRVTAGRHTIEVRLEGYRTETQTVEVAGGADARVSLRLARQEAVATTTTTTTATTATTPSTETSTTTTVAATETTTTETTSEPDVQVELERGDDVNGLRIGLPTIIAGGVTIAALIVTLITGPLALSANAAFERDVMDANMDPVTGDLAPEDIAQARIDGEAHASQARTFATVTDVFLVTTIVGAGATTALFIIDQLGSETAEDEAEEVVVLPVFTPQGVAITAAGRF